MWYRPRLLFQHQPYSEQAALNLNDSDISAVMEGVLDIADGAKIWSVGPYFATFKLLMSIAHLLTSNPDIP